MDVVGEGASVKVATVVQGFAFGDFLFGLTQKKMMN